MPSKEEMLAPLLSALKDLIGWFKKNHIKGIVIGGVTASFLGRPRVTRDIDAVVMLDYNLWNDFLDSGRDVEISTDIEKMLRKHK